MCSSGFVKSTSLLSFLALTLLLHSGIEKKVIQQETNGSRPLPFGSKTNPKLVFSRSVYEATKHFTKERRLEKKVITWFIIFPKMFSTRAAWFIASAISIVVTAASGDFTTGPSFCDSDGWSTMWGDDFDGPNLNARSWNVITSANNSLVRNAQGTRDNVYIENGTLVLRSQRQTVGAWHYTTGAVTSAGNAFFKGSARICVRAKLPSGGSEATSHGLWPAHWLLPEPNVCWPTGGEIDILEMINGDGISHGTYHWSYDQKCGMNNASSGQRRVPHGWSDEFHEYSVEYGPHGIQFALDGEVYHKAVAHDGPEHPKLYDWPYYIILQTAIGGPWPMPPTNATKMPVYHVIDSVKVARHNATRH